MQSRVIFDECRDNAVVVAALVVVVVFIAVVVFARKVCKGLVESTCEKTTYSLMSAVLFGACSCWAVVRR